MKTILNSLRLFLRTLIFLLYVLLELLNIPLIMLLASLYGLLSWVHGEEWSRQNWRLLALWISWPYDLLKPLVKKL